MSRPARGEWIESSGLLKATSNCECLAPQGASGLKVAALIAIALMILSRPARGEWIESTTAAWLLVGALSRPARGEWIERLHSCPQDAETEQVSPRKGRVD